MIVVVPADKAEAATALLREAGETVYTIGTVTEGEGVTYEGNLV
jgi:phosphoribosylformylglycinamidine cyclo-ligase